MPSQNLDFQVSQGLQKTLNPCRFKPAKVDFCCLQLKTVSCTTHAGLFEQWTERKHVSLASSGHSLSTNHPLHPDRSTQILTHNGLCQWALSSSHFWLSSANRKPQHEMKWRREGSMRWNGRSSSSHSFSKGLLLRIPVVRIPDRQSFLGVPTVTWARGSWRHSNSILTSPEVTHKLLRFFYTKPIHFLIVLLLYPSQISYF